MRVILMIVGCVMLLGCGASYSEAEKAGAYSAEQWLVIVDSGAFEDSWVESSTFFQSKVPQSEWVKMVGKARQPFGANLDRSLEDAEFSTTLPGAPDGEYVVAIFKASFEQKASAIETVTVARSDEGKWRVTGYFIK